MANLKQSGSRIPDARSEEQNWIENKRYYFCQKRQISLQKNADISKIKEALVIFWNSYVCTYLPNFKYLAYF